MLQVWNLTISPRGALNFGLSTMCHQKRPYFFRLLSPKDPPFLPTFTQWPPIFNKLLVTERHWHILVTQRPLIFAFNSKTSDNFPQKNWFFENFDKFDEMLRNFWPFWPWKPLLFDAFHWKTPDFCALCYWKTPFLMQFVTERLYIRGAWWHSYITFICECPPRPFPRVTLLWAGTYHPMSKDVLKMFTYFPPSFLEGFIFRLKSRAHVLGFFFILHKTSTCIQRLEKGRRGRRKNTHTQKIGITVNKIVRKTDPKSCTYFLYLSITTVIFINTRWQVLSYWWLTLV